jgi:uncharacterized protein YbaR (Trm112 family)
MTSSESNALDPWFEQELVCPQDKSELTRTDDQLTCHQGHSYPIIYGVPVMLFIDEAATMPKAFASTLAGKLERTSASLLENLDQPVASPGGRRVVDPFVQHNITGICGKHFYRNLTYQLDGYPIPEKLDVPRAAEPEQEVLDIGCNWGRWSVAVAAPRGSDTRQ